MLRGPPPGIARVLQLAVRTGWDAPPREGMGRRRVGRGRRARPRQRHRGRGLPVCTEWRAAAIGSAGGHDAVHVGTLHGLKGLEYQRMILVGIADSAIPGARVEALRDSDPSVSARAPASAVAAVRRRDPRPRLPGDLLARAAQPFPPPGAVRSVLDRYAVIAVTLRRTTGPGDSGMMPSPPLPPAAFSSYPSRTPSSTARSAKGAAAVELLRHHDRPPGPLPGCSVLVLQHGTEGAAADLPQYRIVFRVGQEHDREVQCPAPGPRPQGVAGPAADAGRLVGRPEAP